MTTEQDAIARALYIEGAWCGECEFAGWDTCPACRRSCQGYASAVLAVTEDLIKQAVVDALRGFADDIRSFSGDSTAQAIENMACARASWIEAGQ